ncbi:unnamed protein product, partial [Rotaria magnacalcarata]
MYTQLFKKAFLKIEDDDTQSIKELVDCCRLQNDIPVGHIDKIEREYRYRTPIWWYTAPFFLYSMLNRGFQLMNIDIILKMGSFIRHLHKDIENSRREQQWIKPTKIAFQVFLGQGLSIENFDKMKQTTGGFMSFNNFLSTSRDRQVSFMYAHSAGMNNDLKSVGLLFVMLIDPTLCTAASISFVDVKLVGFYEE